MAILSLHLHLTDYNYTLQELVVASYCITSEVRSVVLYVIPPPTASSWPWKVTREDRTTGSEATCLHTGGLLERPSPVASDWESLSDFGCFSSSDNQYVG